MVQKWFDPEKASEDFRRRKQRRDTRMSTGNRFGQYMHDDGTITNIADVVHDIPKHKAKPIPTNHYSIVMGNDGRETARYVGSSQNHYDDAFDIK